MSDYFSPAHSFLRQIPFNSPSNLPVHVEVIWQTKFGISSLNLWFYELEFDGAIDPFIIILIISWVNTIFNLFAFHSRRYLICSINYNDYNHIHECCHHLRVNNPVDRFVVDAEIASVLITTTSHSNESNWVRSLLKVKENVRTHRSDWSCLVHLVLIVLTETNPQIFHVKSWEIGTHVNGVSKCIYLLRCETVNVKLNIWLTIARPMSVGT